MQIFDFDNTLYHGESAVDFALFMIKRNKRIIKWLPTIFYNLFKYKLCLVKMDEMERLVNNFLCDVIRNKKEVMEMTELFWKTHRKRLDERIVRRIRSGDMIITAGPSFLIDAIKSELGEVRLICSEIDLDAKKLCYLNFAKNKAKKFRELCGERKITSFYTDSYNDKALMEISEKVFMVKRKRVERIK